MQVQSERAIHSHSLSLLLMFLAAARALEIWVVVRSSFLARRMKDGSNVRAVMMHHVNFLPPSLLTTNLATAARMSESSERERLL